MTEKDKTKQPRKQRKQRSEAPLHQRHKFVTATLSDELREEYGTRRARVSQGDTVEVMRGDFAGEESTVAEVDLDEAKVYVDDITLEKVDGEEVRRPIDASNLRITELDLEDPRREERIRGGDEG
ncbi:MAG: 50S ribosomal protein L24 [Halobacteria archaeon]|nr:50S ribosomal protein L24 [Halobacteria archaeon]